RQGDHLRNFRRGQTRGSESSCPDRALPLLRDEIRRIPDANVLEFLGCVYVTGAIVHGRYRVVLIRRLDYARRPLDESLFAPGQARQERRPTHAQETCRFRRDSFRSMFCQGTRGRNSTELLRHGEALWISLQIVWSAPVAT